MSSTLLDQAEQLVTREQWREAIDLLSHANRDARDIEIERKLTDYRLQAHSAMSWPASTSWAGDWSESTPRSPAIYEIDAGEFNARSLARGLLGHGAMIVRDLVPRDVAEQLVDDIDNTIAARESEDENSPWQYYSPHISVKRGNFGHKDKAQREKTRKGSIQVAESPRTMQRLIDLYESIGLRSVLAEYFGEPGALSVRKWVLRRILPSAIPAGWHQDGRFLGTDYRAVNLWLPLSECGEGTEAAGIEVMPVVNREIFETGTGSASFQWTVSNEVVAELEKSNPIHHPHFNPGDALFFDHFNLHRTAFGPHLTQPRYAVEAWFFNASAFPEKQGPILF